MSETRQPYGGDLQSASLARVLGSAGFDAQRQLSEGWVQGVSYGSPLVVYVRWNEDRVQLALNDLSVLAPAMKATGVSPVGFVVIPAVARAGADAGIGTEGPGERSLPMAELAGEPALHEALAAAFLATRGDGRLDPLEAYALTTARLPQRTEAERLVVQRVGQDLFRAALMKRWRSRCAVTGLAIPELLRASHIKPWSRCASDAERLDPDNGLLLAANWDAAFDQGFVSFEDDGTVRWSSRLPPDARAALGLQAGHLGSLTPQARAYLTWHRDHVFLSGVG